jgi:ABC-2 type transport system ATP-binding protein
MLQARGLRKSFGELRAVVGVSLTLEPGRILGLLGPNGAGKTTTVSMLTGLVTPDAGEVLIAGHRLAGDADSMKRRIGLVPQDLALYEELSARANLRFFGGLYGLAGLPLDRAGAAAQELVGLADRLLHDPDVVLLDEPTVGVDPQSRHAIFDNLEHLKGRGKALLYTTHYMEEAERLADRIVIMDHGRVIADDTLDGLCGAHPGAGSLERVFLALTGRSLRD